MTEHPQLAAKGAAQPAIGVESLFSPRYNGELRKEAQETTAIEDEMICRAERAERRRSGDPGRSMLTQQLCRGGEIIRTAANAT